MKTISVIIPLYNKVRYIRRALDSVLKQTYKDFEIIVIDDGSSDAGPAIVKGYRDNKVKLIRQRNAGPGAARNRGLAESKGSFVSFLDADDEWMPEFLEKCITALNNNPDCDVAAAAYYLGTNRKDISTEFRRRGMNDGAWKLSNEISDSELKHSIYILHSSSTLCKKNIIEKYGGFYAKDNCKLGEDYYLWLQIMFNHNIFRILKPLWWFHIEASECGSASLHNQIRQPFLTDIEQIKKNCPEILLPLMERWLSQYALRLAQECMYNGESRQVENLINRFPAMKTFHWEYFKLKTKILMPQLIPVVRLIKQQLCQ
ncbi:MAG: hypothetical protein A2Y10_03210 [Planctomycetes bacterium GWF2_41_51]|nr:MAG: hypothetical protein A2Y10_03210 [Planctomycetes bacterium GWF2_41_51]HBG28282.1 glycosyltransferase family 2 protein [Phycisphaerales bacterium]